jgi:hypothetical protein
MKIIYCILTGTALILLLCTLPVLAPIKTEQLCNTSFDEIFQDIVADYETYTSLMYDVYPIDQYQVSIHVNTPEAATAYLCKSFSPALAADIAGYYLKWLPLVDKMAIIPAESIPIITEADRLYLNIERISPDKVLIKRIYNDCYEQGDSYLYCIVAQNIDGTWIIEDLQLNSL